AGHASLAGRDGLEPCAGTFFQRAELAHAFLRSAGRARREGVHHGEIVPHHGSVRGSVASGRGSRSEALARPDGRPEQRDGRTQTFHPTAPELCAKGNQTTPQHPGPVRIAARCEANPNAIDVEGERRRRSVPKPRVAPSGATLGPLIAESTS